MTVVSEDQVSVALDYLNADPHPMALARKDVVDAENKVKRTFAIAFLAAEGSVEQRKQVAEINADHIAAKVEEVNAILDLEKNKERLKWAEMIIAVFQTESANARGAERIR